MDEKVSPAFILEQTLSTVGMLKAGAGDLWKQKVVPLEAPRGMTPPLVIYIQETETEEETLEGGSGLLTRRYHLLMVAVSFDQLDRLCFKCRVPLLNLQGSTWDGDGVEFLVERVTLEQRSPDIREPEVGYYRRSYDLEIDYQVTERSDNPE